MKMQLLAFAHDLAVLYVGLPGQWLFIAYCLWLRQRKQRTPAAEWVTSESEAMLVSSSHHLVSWDLMDFSRYMVRLARTIQQTLGRNLQNWGRVVLGTSLHRSVLDFPSPIVSAPSVSVLDRVR